MLQSSSGLWRRKGFDVFWLVQEKLAIKEKKEADEAKFKFAQVDGRTEQVQLPHQHIFLQTSQQQCIVSHCCVV